MALVAVTDGSTADDTDINQYKEHLEGDSGKTLAWLLRAATGSDITMLLADSAGARKFIVADSTSAEVFSIDSNGVIYFGGAAMTTSSGIVKHEYGGVETDISAITTGDVLAGTGAGTVGIVAASGASDGDVLTLQADGTLAYEAVPSGVHNHDTDYADIDHDASHVQGGSDEIDGDHLDIDYTPSNYTPSTSPAEASSVDHLTAHLAGIDAELAGGVGTHATAHIDGGTDPIDGDKLEISWVPSHYSRSATPTEADSTDDLTAHLYGIDQALNLKAASTHNHSGTYADATHASTHHDDGSDPIDGDKLQISWTGMANYTRTTSPSEVNSADELTSHLKGIDDALAGAGSHTIASHSDTTATGAELETLTDGSDADALHTHAGLADTSHAASHKDGGSDPIDGDQLQISWTGMNNYTRDNSPAEVNSADDLTSHLKGIDTAIGNAGGVQLIHSSDTEYSPTTTSESDLLDITGLNVPANHGLRLEFSVRIDASSAPASRNLNLAIHVNGSEIISSFNAIAAPNAGENVRVSFIELVIPPHSTSYIKGTSATGPANLKTWYSDSRQYSSSDLPTAATTSVTIRGSLSHDDGEVAGIKHVRLYEYPN